jgi:c-di-GMP-binding flagellar brake protein YcgR
MDPKETLDLINTFFHQDEYRVDTIKKGIDEGVIITDKSFIANILKGTLHDENIVEVELNKLTRVYFCRILDYPPEKDESTLEENGASMQPVYTKGSYLNSFNCVIATPVEPGIGNFLVCPAQHLKAKMLLRIITSRQGYEFGCFFDAKIQVGGIPVLQLTFPVIAMKIPNAREFRAKIPKTMPFTVAIEMKERNKQFTTFPLDISAHGMVLIDPMGKHTDLKVNEQLSLNLQIEKQEPVLIDANIKHITKLRDTKGTQHCFGVQFDLATRALASSVEGLVASVQRVHLRELLDIADQFGINYENW